MFWIDPGLFVCNVGTTQNFAFCGEKKMKKRILLVDDEVAVLLTLKAVLEINGFEVDTAASGREGKLKLRAKEYHMVISDMRMESEQAGVAVIEAARSAPYHPAVAVLTAYPLADEDWQELGADRMLVKPMQTRLLLEQIDRLMESHVAKQSDDDLISPTTGKRTASRSSDKNKLRSSGDRLMAKAASTSKKLPLKKKSAKAEAKIASEIPTARRGHGV